MRIKLIMIFLLLIGMLVGFFLARYIPDKSGVYWAHVEPIDFESLKNLEVEVIAPINTPLVYWLTTDKTYLFFCGGQVAPEVILKCEGYDSVAVPFTWERTTHIKTGDPEIVRIKLRKLGTGKEMKQKPVTENKPENIQFE